MSTSVFGNIQTGEQLAIAAVEVAKNYKTLYVKGCFGAPLNEANKKRWTEKEHYNFNNREDRLAQINAASADTFGFDCVCFIKALLWGWCGDVNHVYGGVKYQSNGVPDIDDSQIIQECSDVSTDFSHIEVGELLWRKGHVGIYVGNGLSAECTTNWDNKVQITACNEPKSGYNTRKWTKHGKLPYVSYGTIEPYTQTDFVKDIQKIAGVKITGIADDETLSKTVTLSAEINNRHAMVKPVQKYLYSLGITCVGEADGKAGSKFTKAVNEFQVKYTGMEEGDGELTATKKSWKKLLGYVAPSKKTETPKSKYNFKVEDEVLLTKGAKYTNGASPKSWVYDTKLYIRELRSGDTALVSNVKEGPIYGVVYLKDLMEYPQGYKVQVTAELLNVRKGPGTSYAVISQVKKNTTLTVMKESGNWGQITTGGWVSLKYTKRV